MFRSLLLTFLILLGLPLVAQESDGFQFGNDSFLAGRAVGNSTAGVDDLFAMGDSVSSSVALGGSAHLFGRNISISGPVGENLYAMGKNVTVSAPIAGDVIVAGDNVNISGQIDGDLRAMGSTVTLNASVGDAALVGGETVIINAVIDGDLGVSAQSVEFGPDAKVIGQLHVYSSDPAAVEVPERVASADQIVLHQEDEWSMNMSGPGDAKQVSAWQKFRGFVVGILWVTVLVTLVAAIAPNFVSRIRERALDAPIWAGWVGFLSLSAFIGSIVLVAMTGFGILLVPLVLLATFLLGLVGYLVGTYVLGVGLMGVAGRDMPDSLGDRALAAFIGAVVVAVISLIPFLGWLFLMVLVLVGAGAIIVRWFAPGFYTEIE